MNFKHLQIRKYVPAWEWFVLLATIVILALFVLGKDWFGLNGLLSSVFALGGAIATTLVAFIAAALIGPLIALVTTLLTSIIAALGIVVGTLVMPVAALFTGLFSTIVAWLATTWVGALFSPVYALIAPVLLKISPLLTLSKYATKAYDWLDDQSWWPQKLVFTSNKKLAKKKSGSKKAAGKRRK